jgi:hypothetical protein
LSQTQNETKGLRAWFKRQSICLGNLGPWVQSPLPGTKKKGKKEKRRISEISTLL